MTSSGQSHSAVAAKQDSLEFAYAIDAVVDVLGRDVDAAQKLARELARDLDTVCASDGTLVRASNLIPMIVMHVHIARDPQLAEELAPLIGRTASRMRLEAVTMAIKHMSELIPLVERARGRDRSLGRRIVMLGDALLSGTLEIAGSLDLSEKDIAEVERYVNRASPVTSPEAGHIVKLAARLLPARHRLDKAEEFASELYDLTEAGASRRQQIAHSLRVLLGIVSLRRELSNRRHRVLDRDSADG